MRRTDVARALVYRYRGQTNARCIEVGFETLFEHGFDEFRALIGNVVVG